MQSEPTILILMGVTGSGKTTIGRLFADSAGWKFFDADDFHPAANIEKMKRGLPLNDEDRKPWLESLSELIRDCLQRKENAVLACSALKESYRRLLLIDECVKLVFLEGNYELIKQRLNDRHEHYMNPALLDSQFQTLEEPAECLRIDASLPPHEVVNIIRNHLSL